MSRLAYPRDVVNPRRRSIVYGVVAVLVLSCAPGCGRASDPPPIPRLWVVQRGYADQIRYLAPDLARRLLGPSSVLLGETAHHDMTAFAWPSYDWFQSMVNGTGDYAGLANARGWLRPLRAVLYDPEGWDATPLAERVDPTAYFRRFAALAPGTDMRLTWGVMMTVLCRA